MASSTGTELPTSSWQKYDSYAVPTDEKQNDKATCFKFTTFKRPHMRAFYISTFSFFIAFTAWFSFAPLMPEVKKTLHLTKHQVYNSNVLSVCMTVVARFVVGPLCDAFGARIVYALLLFCGSIPTFCSGLVNSANDLYIVRFFIGILGATFVTNQAWMSQMFSKEFVGTANATAAGWGNLGGGVTQLLMVSLWGALRKNHTDEQAWRLSFLVPASIVMFCSLFLIPLSDDSPKGNFNDLIKHGAIVRKSSKKAAGDSLKNVNSWICMLQYAASFGTELVIFNTAASYFHDTFGMTTQNAGYVATSFGFMNIFSRSSGGWLSDFLYRKLGSGSTGMRGRIWIQFACVFLEGVFLLLFSRVNTLTASIILLIPFALFCQMANGTLYGIIPYVHPESTGAVSGLVGAGGNIGAIAWGLMFRFGPTDETRCYMILSFIIMGLSFFNFLINIRGHDTMLTKAKEELPAMAVI